MRFPLNQSSKSRRRPSKGRRKKNRILPAAFFSIGLTLGTAFGIYLWNLNLQLSEAFDFREQFIPTRIYSDTAEIKASLPRLQIEARLQALGYNYSSTQQTIKFHLHPIDYPQYLLPDSHPQLNFQEPNVSLYFESKGKKAGLHSIQIEGQEQQTLYLEPELIATLSRPDQTKREIRTFLKFDEVPSLVWKAIIAIEDQHFLEHKGLDPRGIARAIWVNLKTLSFAQGGSTITQQLVKNLMARRTKNIFQKVNEVFLSFLLEAKFEKEQILERYLNEVYLGQIGYLEVHGVAEGAEHFFGKKIQDLNLSEVALMAGLIRGPGFYSPYRHKERAIERQHLVLTKMAETGQIAKEEALAAMKVPLRLSPAHTTTVKSPFFVDYVKIELVRLLKGRITEQELIKSGFRVYTTLDMRLNQIAQDSISSGIALLEGQIKTKIPFRLEGALVSTDHSTGQIRALIGGRNYAQSNFNRILNMKRQVGSTFKPFVYLAAIQKGEDPNGIPYGPGHPAEDAPWTLIYDRGRQTWSPKNHEGTTRGWTSLREALAYSINTVAAKLGNEIGLEPIKKLANSLGIETPLPSVPSLSLGTAELSPVELLQAYSTVANHGLKQDLQVIRGVTQTNGMDYARFSSKAEQVVDPASADLLTDMLQDVFKYGTARTAQTMGFHRPSAGKTGTTNNYRDAWFAGYTPQLTTVVWVGADQSNLRIPQLKLTGGNSALPIWISFMRRALESEPSVPFPTNSQLTEVKIDRRSGKKANFSCPSDQVTLEKYIQGHEPQQNGCESFWPPSIRETVQD